MPRVLKEKAARLTAALCLSFLFYLQPAPAAGQDKKDDEPLGVYALVDLVHGRKHTTKELIRMAMRRGVKTYLNDDYEGDLRAAGKHLDKAALDELVKALRANFIGADVNEPLVLGLGSTARLPHLGFKATYVRKDGDDYVLEIGHPDNDRVIERTHADCEHTYVWGNNKRKFRLHIDSATPQEVQAVLLHDAKPPSTPPERIREYTAPCSPVQMRLVTGNHTDAPGAVVSYYISEPLTVGVLRHYARTPNPLRTPIPAAAKDSDPITAIYYKDAVEIAMMVGTRLPTLHQLVNALNGDFMSLSPQGELAEDSDGNLIVVRQADSQNPSNTPLSSRVTTSTVPREGLATGLLRGVRPVPDDRRPHRPHVIDKQNRPLGP
jgi:hypothetical protein